MYWVCQTSSTIYQKSISLLVAPEGSLVGCTRVERLTENKNIH